MKKFLLYIMTFVAAVSLAGCGAQNASENYIKKLNVMFVPSQNPDKIAEASAPLENIIKTSLINQGYSVGDVSVSVGDSYEVVGEALASGTVDVGFIPASTYVQFEDQGVEVLLSATRKGLSIKSYNPAVWNANKPTTTTDELATHYDSLILAGPSQLGQEMANLVNTNQPIPFEMLNQAKWCTGSPTASAGYVYPNLWLENNYDRGITDLEHVTRTNGYGDSLNSLASGVCDIAPVFSDVRQEYVDTWSGQNDIWTDTNVIAVSGPIMNDTISVSNNSPYMTDRLKEVLKNTFLDLPNSAEGRQVMSCYSHTGYMVPKPEDYDPEREILEMNQKK